MNVRRVTVTEVYQQLAAAGWVHIGWVGSTEPWEADAMHWRPGDPIFPAPQTQTLDKGMSLRG